jgi:hypothetical protein
MSEENKDVLDSIFNEEEIETEEEIKKRKKEEMIEKIKSIGKNLGIILIVCLIGYWLFFSNSDDNKSDNLTEEKIEESIEKKNLIDKYSPIIFSDESFEFTKDIQDKLDKNFLLEVEINDLYKKGNKVFLKVSPVLFSSYFGTFEIDEKQENFIRNNKEEYFINEFFAVVKIENVFKPEFEINGEIDDDYVYLDDYYSDVFIFRGKLIDIKKDN